MTMAKDSSKGYEDQLCNLIRQKTNKDPDPWLMPQIRATASNMVVIDRVQQELENQSMVIITTGSMGQQKNEVNPLIPYYERLQRTLMLQYQAIGLTNRSEGGTKSTPEQPVDIDPMAEFYKNAKKL